MDRIIYLSDCRTARKAMLRACKRADAAKDRANAHVSEFRRKSAEPLRCHVAAHRGGCAGAC